MIRIAVMVIGLFCAFAPCAAEELYHEDLRIPMAAAGPHGLEALLIRPSSARRYPLALISHGAPRNPADRAGMTANGMYAEAVEFARHGFAAVIVMRRGYGSSGGDYVENSGSCDHRNYLVAAKESVSDLKAATDAMSARADITTQGMIAVGVSAGGFASVAFGANPPPGLAAVISFAGGRGSQGDNDVCNEDGLVNTFASLGKTARVPMLWVYSQNDKFFRPELAHRFYSAFSAGGGHAELIDAPAFGDEGHFLFSAAGRPIWTPMVDRFLRAQNLGLRELIAFTPPKGLVPPRQLSENGRAGFATYLASGPHRAFAVSPKGAFAFRTGQRSAAEAERAALEACAKYTPDCQIYAIDDALTGKGIAGSH